MKKLKSFITVISVIFLCSCTGGAYKLQNDKISRTISTDKYLHTIEIENKLNGETITPSKCEEFSLRISDGTDKTGTDKILTSEDFTVNGVEKYSGDGIDGIAVKLRNKETGLSLTVKYELEKNASYMRKFIEIESDENVTLERLDVESITLEDAYQTYFKKYITAYAPGNWSPGLGFPIYTTKTGSFWGMEFPAATNTVTNNNILTGYLWGKEIVSSEKYISHKSVVGMADDAKYIDDAFMSYIDDVRIRPLRLQIQYNCWFDFGHRVNSDNFKESVEIINNELSVKRNVKPLSAYVIDDGWEDTSMPDLDKPNGVWSINDKFSRDFVDTHKLMKDINSSLGLWLSPGCFFGSRKQVDVMREKGYESLSLSMSMAGPKYMDKLETRILELTKQGITYFKYDGLFGHLNIRDFELNGRGTAAMPQLNTEGFAANDVRLNHPMYDELKLYYLTAGTERLMELMKKQHEVNPNVYTAITNGAYLSPWWLMYTDVVWLINCGDAAGGADRSAELVYRDGVYHEVFVTENTKFPINSIFNHEPKKTLTGESTKEFRDYLFMNLSRGAGFIELYIKTKNLSQSDWDVMAEGLKWADEIFPAFKNVKMFGGDPRENKAYGYSGWADDRGYISIHNPSGEEITVDLVLNRDMGMKQDDKLFKTASVNSSIGDLSHVYKYGDTLKIKLGPKEVRILTFSR